MVDLTIQGGCTKDGWMDGMMSGDNRQTDMNKYYSPMPFFCRWSLHTSFWAIFLQPTQSSSSLPPSLCRTSPALLPCSSPSLDAGGVGKGNSAPPTTISRPMASDPSSLVQERFGVTGQISNNLSVGSPQSEGENGGRASLASELILMTLTMTREEEKKKDDVDVGRSGTAVVSLLFVLTIYRIWTNTHTHTANPDGHCRWPVQGACAYVKK